MFILNTKIVNFRKLEISVECICPGVSLDLTGLWLRCPILHCDQVADQNVFYSLYTAYLSGRLIYLLQI